MQTKIYNAYRLSHKNGSIEDVNALNLVQALENMETPETESVVIQAVLLKEGVRTLVADEPTEVVFSAVVETGGMGSVATPASGTVHVGDQIALKAIPARNYQFVSWAMNGENFSENASLVYTIPELPEGITSIVFTAKFALAPVAWTATVSPSEAGSAGAIAFPSSGTTEANAEAQFLAVEAEGYTFSHWERNGETLGTNKMLSVDVAPLAEGEESAVYTAVFTAG